jgi:thiol-disulfide isomerase/thioredoxin
MKPRSLLTLALGLALLAPACGGKGGAETTGQTIRAATFYNVVPYRDLAKRKTPKAWKALDLAGGTLRSSSFRGSVTVVNFWASWCGPCRVEQAELEKLYNEYAARGVSFVGVNVRDTPTNARSHLEEFGVTYPSVFNKDSTIAFKFRVLFIPTTFVLDKRGRIAAKVIGPTVEDDLTSFLDTELAR